MEYVYSYMHSGLLYPLFPKENEECTWVLLSLEMHDDESIDRPRRFRSIMRRIIRRMTLCFVPLQYREREQEESLKRSSGIHYQRRCRLFFPCCQMFYACHKCHNTDSVCGNDRVTSNTCTMVECGACLSVFEIDENSQVCKGCNSVMSDSFCSICKIYTTDAMKPFHCVKCGVCRIRRDDAFHCNVCGVCVTRSPEGTHGCRADSAHDKCTICYEDVFWGGIILPCSHKFHTKCVEKLVEYKWRECPVCRKLFNPTSLIARKRQ